MFAQIGSVPEFALAVIGNVLTLCSFIYLISMNERQARHLARTFFKLQLPTMMLLVAVGSGLLAANLNTHADGVARNYGWPVAAVSISHGGAVSVNGWALLANLCTGFGLLIPLLALVEGGLRKQRGLTFEPAARFAGVTLAPVDAERSEASLRGHRSFRELSPEAAQAPRRPFRLPAFAFSGLAALLLLGATVLLKRAWIPWVVDCAYIEPEHSIDPGSVTALAFFPDQNRFVCGYKGGQLVVWTLRDGRYSIMRYIGHTAPITSIRISDNGEALTSCSSDNEARFWRTTTGSQLLRLGPGDSVVSRQRQDADKRDCAKIISAQYLNDDHFAAACGDGIVRIYDSQEHVSRAFIGDMGKLSWIGAVPGGDALVCVNWRGLMQFWNCFKPATPDESQATDLKYENDDAVRLWNDDAIVLKGDTTELVEGYVVKATDIAARHQFWVLTSAHHGKVDLWSPGTGRRVRSVPDLLPTLKTVTCTGDGKTIVTTDEQDRVQEWKFEPNATLAAHAAEVRSFRASPDNRQFLTASRDGTAHLWDSATGRGMAVFSGNTSGLLLAAFSAAGDRVITAAEDGSVRVFDATTQAEIAAVRGDAQDNRSADISADGSRALFLRRDGTVRICAMDPPRELGVLPAAPNTEITLARFEPNGHRVLAGYRDATLKIWKNVLQWPSGLSQLWQTAAVGILALTTMACFVVEWSVWRRKRATGSAR